MAETAIALPPPLVPLPLIEGSQDDGALNKSLNAYVWQPPQRGWLALFLIGLAGTGLHPIRGAGVQQTRQLVWSDAGHKPAGTLRVLIRVFQGRLHLRALQVAAIIWRRWILWCGLRRQVRWRGIRRLWIRLLRCR